MTDDTSRSMLAAHQCVSVGARTLHTLRASLERDLGGNAATYLQEAGFSGGGELYGAFTAWLAGSTGVSEPGALDRAHLPGILTAFFTTMGWGSLDVTQLGDALLSIESVDWAEAEPTAGAMYPTCHVTSGLLSSFMGHLGGGMTAVLEVECRSRGDARCRFLAGAPETMHAMYERLAAGLGVEQAIGQG
ncbi:MAG TPA: V4R domain-containing protein [Gemmatimonadales bacterium]|nr:V4R domain-containing protein [Gemmatimonadales bacterium]